MSVTRPPDLPGPKGITDEQIIEALEKNAGVITLAAKALGVRRQTLSDRVNASPRLDAARRDADAEVTEIATAVVVEKIVKGKDAKVAQWWLERRGGEAFANKHRHGGLNGKPLFDVDGFLKGLSDAELNRLDAQAPRGMGAAGEDPGPSGGD